MIIVFFVYILSFFPIAVDKEHITQHLYIALTFITFLSYIEFLAVIISRNISILLFEDKTIKRKYWTKYINFKEIILNNYSLMTRSD